MEINILKYSSWILTILISFSGAWFFQFTITNKNNNRRSLTKFGKVAFVFASIVLFISIYLFISDDLNAQHAKEKAEDRAVEQERIAAVERAKAEGFRKETSETLASLSSLVNGWVQKGALTEDDLSDLERVFPDLADEIQQASLVDDAVSLRDLWSIAEIDMARGAMQRFDWKNPMCNSLFSVYPDARGWQTEKPLLVNDEILIAAHTDSDSAYLRIFPRNFASDDFNPVAGKLRFTSDEGDIYDVKCNSMLSFGKYCQVDLAEGFGNQQFLAGMRNNELDDIRLEYSESDIDVFEIPEEVSRKLTIIGNCVLP